MCWMVGVTSRVTNGLVDSSNMTHKVYIGVPLWGACRGVGKTAGARTELRAFVGAQQFERPHNSLSAAASLSSSLCPFKHPAQVVVPMARQYGHTLYWKLARGFRKA